MRVLITGVGGFIGYHLTEFLLSKGCTVVGTELGECHNGIHEKISVMQCDVIDSEKVKSIIRELDPDVIFHLAAQSYPDVSWAKPNLTMKVNVEGTVNLFEAIRQLKVDPLVFIPGSGAEYGVSDKDAPLEEDYRLLPVSPYGVSKVMQDLLGYQYYKNYSIRCIRVRLFNSTGPKRLKDVCSDFTRRAVMIEKGLTDNVLKVGNLETKRAITDVRDVVNALWMLIEKGKPGDVYNICTSNVYKMKDVLDKVVSITGISPTISQDQSLMRVSDEPVLIGDTAKLKQHTGWEAEIPLDDTLKDMVEQWRLTL
ncbi:MAG: GDP-mannose 4,6-dehydratase [Nanoarchaeota archaeon]